MTAFNENNLNDPNENLRNLRQGENANADPLGENTGSSALESSNPYTQAEDPAGNAYSGAAMGNDLNRDEGYGENAGIIDTDISNSNVAPGPGDDDDLDDDDDLLDDDDDDTLIPIEGDEEDDSLLSADDDDDVIPGTDMDDGDDLLDDDDDLDDDDSGVNRSTTGNIGTDFSRNDGRTSGRMIDHEPGTGGI